MSDPYAEASGSLIKYPGSVLRQTLLLALYSFQGPPRHTQRSSSAGGLSKLSSVPSDIQPLGSPVDVLEKLPRKEVIQPQLPLRLPCYDFTPITGPTFDGSLQKVRPPASGVTCFRGVTGGVYKARERIHRSIADLRLLATPASWRRVSASNPNRDALSGIRSTSRYCCPLYAPM